MSTILLADDEDSLRALVRATLSGDHRLIEARDGREALEAARRERPDLVLLDGLMPEVDGFEVCRRLKDDPATRGIRVIMLTGLDAAADLDRGRAAGVDDYLTKPFRPAALLATIDRALGGD